MIDRFAIRSSRLLVGLALVLVLFGCRPSEPPQPSSSPRAKATEAVSLRVLVVDDLPLSERIEREWVARTGSALQMNQISAADFLSLTTKSRLGADIIVYPSALLGELAERELIIPIAEEALDDPSYDLRDVFTLVRAAETAWDKNIYGVSLGSPVLSLYYRRDLFDELNLSPPTTWQEYLDAVQKLSQLAQSKQETGSPAEWVPNIEPLATGWAGQMLMAHSAAYARHRSSYSTFFNFATMEPLIDQPSFVRGLEELIAATKEGTEASLQATPSDTRRLFYEGKCAMAVSWPSAAAAIPTTKAIDVAQIGIANLPGSPDVYNFRDSKWEQRTEEQSNYVPLLGVAGRLASVTRESRYQQDASNFILWLTGPELGPAVSPASESTMFFRRSHIPSAGQWLDSAFDKSLVEQSVVMQEQLNSADAWFVSLNIPGRSEYVWQLDEAVQGAVRDQKKPADILQDVVARWKAITAELGTEKQRLAYQHSLGVH